MIIVQIFLFVLIGMMGFFGGAHAYCAWEEARLTRLQVKLTKLYLQDFMEWLNSQF